jgi:hypothetical protein
MSRFMHTTHQGLANVDSQRAGVVDLNDPDAEADCHATCTYGHWEHVLSHSIAEETYRSKPFIVRRTAAAK